VTPFWNSSLQFRAALDQVCNPKECTSCDTKIPHHYRYDWNEQWISIHDQDCGLFTNGKLHDLNMYWNECDFGKQVLLLIMT
jgi:hypothetical protein